MNIYKELQSDIDGFQIPKHGYLVGWARQGIHTSCIVLHVQGNLSSSLLLYTTSINDRKCCIVNLFANVVIYYMAD